MRATIFLSLMLLCHSSVHANQFIFKNGKAIQGSILYEDAWIYRITDSTGVEMRLRKSELDVTATESANVFSGLRVSEPAPQAPKTAVSAKRTVPLYSNRDVQSVQSIAFTPPNPESEQAWLRSLSRLEREFVRFQKACRGAGTGPNLSKILRTHTYEVKGKPVKITAYWADPANIEDAKKICRRAIQTEDVLQEARKQFADFQQRQQRSPSAR